MHLKQAEELMIKNHPIGFHWNTKNSVSTLSDGCGGQNGLTLILKDGHLISFSLGLHGALEKVRVSSFLHQLGYSEINQAQIFENIMIFTEKHGSNLFIFSWDGRWKQSTVGPVDLFESMSLFCKSPNINCIDVELEDVHFRIHEKKPLIFAFNDSSVKLYRLISKASQ